MKSLILLLFVFVSCVGAENKNESKEKIISEGVRIVDGYEVWEKTVELPPDSITPIKKKTNNEFKYPKPIKDSSWSYGECDTLFGIIEIPAASGSIRGKGMVVSCRYWDCSTQVYSAKDQASIDSFQKANQSWWSNGGCLSIGEPTKTAYIKYKNGYKKVDDNFTFIPK